MLGPHGGQYWLWAMGGAMGASTGWEPWSVLLDVVCIATPSHLRKPANATRQMASWQTSAREGNGPADSTMASNIAAIANRLMLM